MYTQNRNTEATGGKLIIHPSGILGPASHDWTAGLRTELADSAVNQIDAIEEVDHCRHTHTHTHTHTRTNERIVQIFANRKTNSEEFLPSSTGYLGYI